MKKYIYAFISTVLMTVLFIGCSSDSEFYNVSEIEEKVETEDDVLTLSEKFQNIQGRGEELLTRSMNINRSELKLCAYKRVKVIESDDELARIKLQIASDKSVFPYYDLDNKCLSLLTWSEIDKEKQYDQFQYSRNSLVDYLNKYLKVGMEQFELTWQCGSEIYKTICITSGNSIIYDNVITNALCLSDETSKNIEATEKKLLKTRQEQGGDYSLTETVVDVGAYWLWGSERGRVTITHSIYVRNGELDNSGYTTSDYISIGSSASQAQIISRSLGRGGSSTCNYVYYLATPTISASISGGNGIRYNISISGFGSEAHGSSDHILYAY